MVVDYFFKFYMQSKAKRETERAEPRRMEQAMKAAYRGRLVVGGEGVAESARGESRGRDGIGGDGGADDQVIHRWSAAAVRRVGGTSSWAALGP